MRKISMIEESLNEFAKRGRPRKNARKPIKKDRGIDAPDTWGETEDEEVVDPNEFEVDTSDMDAADEIEVEEEDVFDDQLFKALSNEIKLSEPARRVLRFRLKGDTTQLLNAVPMAKMGNNAFIFKLPNGSLKKIFLRDIILEQQRANRAKTVNEYFPEVHDREWSTLTADEEIPRKKLHKREEEEEDHECQYYLDRYGKCRICGRWPQYE